MENCFGNGVPRRSYATTDDVFRLFGVDTDSVEGGYQFLPAPPADREQRNFPLYAVLRPGDTPFAPIKLTGQSVHKAQVTITRGFDGKVQVEVRFWVNTTENTFFADLAFNWRGKLKRQSRRLLEEYLGYTVRGAAAA